MKTETVWEVQGNYGRHGWETVTAEPDRGEALTRLREYRDNDPTTPYRLRRVRA